MLSRDFSLQKLICQKNYSQDVPQLFRRILQYRELCLSDRRESSYYCRRLIRLVLFTKGNGELVSILCCRIVK
jgi:hypothetical protein